MSWKVLKERKDSTFDCKTLTFCAHNFLTTIFLDI